MRAVCGAIIAAGAMIGLGLTAIGIGNRYTRMENVEGDALPYVVFFKQLDHPLTFILVFLTGAALAGLAISLVGLAYHHARREREWAWEQERSKMRTTV
jgi:hypothetical protein